MEIENTSTAENHPFTPGVYPKIYSKRAIWGFCILFTTVFGGVLLMQNLRDTGRKKEAFLMLILSITLTVLSMIIVNLPEKPVGPLGFACNIVGGVILTEIFYKKYFLDDSIYEKKKIWKPLIISILITIPFILVLVFG